MYRQIRRNRMTENGNEFVDYYGVLGVPNTATNTEIKRPIAPPTNDGNS